MCLRSWGLIEEAKEDGDDDELDDEDVRKPRGFGRGDSDNSNS
jgi:hypothetical protein